MPCKLFAEELNRYILPDVHWHSCNVRCLSNFYFLHNLCADQFLDQCTVLPVQSLRCKSHATNFEINDQPDNFQAWCHDKLSVSCVYNNWRKQFVIFILHGNFDIEKYICGLFSRVKTRICPWVTDYKSSFLSYFKAFFSLLNCCYNKVEDRVNFIL